MWHIVTLVKSLKAKPLIKRLQWHHTQHRWIDLRGTQYIMESAGIFFIILNKHLKDLFDSLYYIIILYVFNVWSELLLHSENICFIFQT